MEILVKSGILEVKAFTMSPTVYKQIEKLPSESSTVAALGDEPKIVAWINEAIERDTYKVFLVVVGNKLFRVPDHALWSWFCAKKAEPIPGNQTTHYEVSRQFDAYLKKNNVEQAFLR